MVTIPGQITTYQSVTCLYGVKQIHKQITTFTSNKSPHSLILTLMVLIEFVQRHL